MKKRRTLTASTLLLFLAMALVRTSSAEDVIGQKAVLVTGASSGIGRNIAERLAAEGHFVYAGARKPADIAALSTLKNVQGIRLDVTVQADIDAAVEAISAAGRGLHGIVNNAGVIVVAPMAETEEADLAFLFDVNTFGPYRITKAFTPLLIESGGRISNISSMAGVASGPAYGAYSMSKHAIEAFTDSLAVEMLEVGVRVSAIEPGAYRSNGGESYCRRRAERGYDPSKSLFPKLAADIASLCDNINDNRYPEPDPVADAVMHALFSSTPRQHYLAAPDQQQTAYVIRDILQDLVDLNAGHPFSYSRDELVAMLDEVLAASK